MYHYPPPVATSIHTIEVVDEDKPIIWPPNEENKAFADLRKYIKRHGFKVPIFCFPGIGKRRVRVLSGHYSFQAAKELGLKTVPVVTVNTIEQVVLWLCGEARDDLQTYEET